MPKLWDMLKEKDKEIIKALMPPGWTPPRDEPTRVRYPSLEEIDKTMRQPPKHQKRGKGW